jgi:hypothetical protein
MDEEQKSTHRYAAHPMLQTDGVPELQSSVTSLQHTRLQSLSSRLHAVDMSAGSGAGSGATQPHVIPKLSQFWTVLSLRTHASHDLSLSHVPSSQSPHPWKHEQSSPKLAHASAELSFITQASQPHVVSGVGVGVGVGWVACNARGAANEHGEYQARDSATTMGTRIIAVEILDQYDRSS